jgi:hypothetical protein
MYWNDAAQNITVAAKKVTTMEVVDPNEAANELYARGKTKKAKKTVGE